MAPTSSPWGAVQNSRQIARGIVEVDTASHGGIHLSPTLNAKVHAAWRDPKGWYEEDCEWAIVALTFPQHFADPMPADGECAGQTVWQYAVGVAKRWMPDEYEKVFGVTVTAEESYIRRQQLVAAATAKDLRSATAWGHRNDGHGRTRVPAGWVGVQARIGGVLGSNGSSQWWYLVPAAEYDNREGNDAVAGLLIDPSRHPEWPMLDAEEVDQPVVVTVGGTMTSLKPDVNTRNTFALIAQAHPHKGAQVGELWRYPAAGKEPEQWRALRRSGMPAGATLQAYATSEEALEAVGFTLAPYAEIPARFVGEDDDGEDMSDVAAVFAGLLAAA